MRIGDDHQELPLLIRGAGAGAVDEDGDLRDRLLRLRVEHAAAKRGLGLHGRDAERKDRRETEKHR